MRRARETPLFALFDLPEPAPVALAIAPEPEPEPTSEPAPDRVIWRDRDGLDWHGRRLGTAVRLARIELDPDQPGGRRSVFREILVNPERLRGEAEDADA